MPDPDERQEDFEDTPEESTDDSDTGVTQVRVPEISGSDDGTPLKEMVEYVARALTANPDAVSVTEEDDGNRTVYRLTVDEKDKGKVIGRDGRVAQSIRSLLRVAATKAGTRVTLEID